MTTFATIERLYLYPVKSMRGVAVQEAHLGLNGFYGDRRFAFVQRDIAGIDSFPWLTGREIPPLILYSPRFESPPMPSPDIPRVSVCADDGNEYEVEDPRLLQRLVNESDTELLLLKNSRGNYDSQHISIFSLATLRDLELESNSAIDHRQFRANLYIEPADGEPFSEDEWIGRVARIGEHAVVGFTKKDSRCMMINLNPETAVQNPRVLRTVTQLHEQHAGIYGNVVAPGLVRVGDAIRIM